MNKFGIVLSLMLIPVAVLMAAPETSAFSRVKVELKLEQPPETEMKRAPESNPKLTIGQRYLVVKVNYYPRAPRNEGPVKETFLDDVKMSVRVLFPAGSRNREFYGMFTGTQNFWTICCDGRNHTAMMFVTPHLLQRYLHVTESYTGMRVPSKGSFRAEVVFTDRSGNELGRGYYGLSGNDSKMEAAFNRLAGKVPENLVIPGAVMPREDTPWSAMSPDQFDLVKPHGLKIPDAPTPPRAGVTLRGQRKGGRRSNSGRGTARK